MLEGRKSRKRPEFEGEDCWEQWEVRLESAGEPELCVTVRDAWLGGRGEGEMVGGRGGTTAASRV